MNEELDRPMPDHDRGLTSPDEKKNLEELWNALSFVTERTAMSDRETDELLERIERSAGFVSASDEGAGTRLPARRSNLMRRIGFTTAALAAVVLLFVLPDRPLSLSAGPGQQLATDLPDGTSVILNSDSRLVFQQTRKSGRTAKLTGEAWFDVSRTGSTFQISTENAVVTVLGTRFSVRARRVDGEPVTDVRVEDGRVILRAVSSETDGVILDQKRSGSVIGDNATPVDHSVEGEVNVPEWTRGDLVFTDVPYHVAVEEASRRLGVSIGMAVPDMAERRINAAFRAPLDASVVLDGLCRPFGLKFRSVADGYEIYQPADKRDRP